MKSAGEYAVTLLIRRRYTEKELWRKMAEKKYTPEEIEDVVLYLKENGSLDDTDYARRFTHDAMLLKGYGKFRVRHQLREKGVDDAIIDDVLSATDIDEKDIILNFLQKHKDVEKESAIRRLMNRGFQYHDIEEVWTKLYG